MKLQYWYYPNHRLVMRGRYEVPDLGAYQPNLLYAEQNLAAILRIGEFQVGSGVLFSQLDTRAVNDNDQRLVYEYPESSMSDIRTDMKVGLLFAHHYQGSNYWLEFYPRVLPRDTKSSGGLTYDYTQLRAGLRKTMLDYNVHLRMNVREIRVLQFNVDIADDGSVIGGTDTLSHYFGYADLVAGIDIPIYPGRKGTSLSWILEIGPRIYMKDTKNTEPFKFFNGQTMLGFNPLNYLEGSLFPGIAANAIIVNLLWTETFGSDLTLRQGVEMEINTVDNRRHGLNVHFGADYAVF